MGAEERRCAPGDVLGSRGHTGLVRAGGARRDQATGPMMPQACAAVPLQV